MVVGEYDAVTGLLSSSGQPLMLLLFLMRMLVKMMLLLLFMLLLLEMMMWWMKRRLYSSSGGFGWEGEYTIKATYPWDQQEKLKSRNYIFVIHLINF